MKRRFAILILIALSTLLVVFASGCFSTISTWWEQQNCKHKYNDGVITVDATCAEEGERVYTCSKCGNEKKEAIATLPHTQFTIQGQAATCLDSGYTDYVICTTCKEIVVEKREIPALGHLETVVKGYAETCLSDGLTNGKKCLRCEKELIGQQVIPCKGHVVVSVGKKASTCTEAGHAAGTKCEKCGKIYSGCEAFPLLEHEPTEEGICGACGKLVNYTYSSEVGEIEVSEVTSTTEYFQKGYYRLIHHDTAKAEFYVIPSTVPETCNDYSCGFYIRNGEIYISIVFSSLDENGDNDWTHFEKKINSGTCFKATVTEGYTDVCFFQDEFTVQVDSVDVSFKIQMKGTGSEHKVTKIFKIS